MTTNNYLYLKINKEISECIEDCCKTLEHKLIPAANHDKEELSSVYENVRMQEQSLEEQKHLISRAQEQKRQFERKIYEKQREFEEEMSERQRELERKKLKSLKDSLNFSQQNYNRKNDNDGSCKIFKVDVKYDNPLLNNMDLFTKIMKSTKLDFAKVLDISGALTQDLDFKEDMKEAVLNQDVGYLSLLIGASFEEGSL